MIRTKKYNCGNYQEIEIFNVSPRKRKYERARKVKESTPAQKISTLKERRDILQGCAILISLKVITA